MIFKIYDGRTEFYQWDLDRKIIVSDPTIDEVHFCNKTGDCALVVEVYEEEGLRLANVPNIALQSDLPIYVYGYCGGSYTKNCASFKVRTRNRPADYIYTETIVKEVFTQTLEGNEEDKAPSVKAVNDALDGKLNKIISKANNTRVYGINANGEQLALNLFTKNKQGYIPLYGTKDGVSGDSDEGGVLVTGMPEKPYQVTPKKYVDEALAGRVEKTTKALKVYGTKGLDGDGNVIHDTYDIYFVPTVAGSILQVTDPTNSNFDTKTPTKTAAVCDPQKPTQIANKQWTEKNFVPIHTQYASKLYGTGGSAGNVTQRFYSMSPIGSTTGDVVNWLLPTNTSFDNKEPVCTIGACDPIKPIQVANKRYVDGKVSELRMGVNNALGVQYTFESGTFSGPFLYIPEGTLPTIYVERVGKATAWQLGEPVGDFDIYGIVALDAEFMPLNYFAPEGDQFITLPEGTSMLQFETDANNYETTIIDASVKFQVKVGG